MNVYAVQRYLFGVLLIAGSCAQAEQFGPYELSGFAKEEFSICDNCSRGLTNPSPYDPRGVLNPPTPMVNQGGPSGQTTANLGLVQLTAGGKYEFDNAIALEAKATGRERNNGPDIYGHYLIDAHAGISAPRWGALQVGTLTARVWARPDSFAYPLGLSSPWAETGAGYGVLPKAIRYSSRMFEIPQGKILFEFTAATVDKAYPLNPASSVIPPPTPILYEGFIQFSDDKQLIELIYQQSNGGLQNSFAKGAFHGSIGNTQSAATTPGWRHPSEDVAILQGTYYLNERLSFTWGFRRSEWSGAPQQCDYSAAIANCYFDQPGFNYASDNGMHHAIEYDGLLGASYNWKLWKFTVGGVHFNKAFTRTPTEWGQSNNATITNVGVYRKVPELSKHLEVYGGLGRTQFGRQGPAPLSMPANTADGNVDPRTSAIGETLTLGANFIF